MGRQGTRRSRSVYVLDHDRNLVPVNDVRPLLDLYNGPPRYWLVGLDHIAEGVFVRTLFVGTGASSDHSEPVFFRTTIITDYGDRWLREAGYPTWEAAKRGHELVVATERGKLTGRTSG